MLFVIGKINDTANTKGRLTIIGYGILDGSYFDYCTRHNDTVSHLSMIESGTRPVTIHGLTIYNPSWFMMTNLLPPNSIIKSYKGIGWFLNQDCCGVSTNGIIQNSFCRTSDDSFKVENGENIMVKDNVAWQLYTGSIHQLGWYGVNANNITIRNIDVIHAEWTGANAESDAILTLTGIWNASIDMMYSNIIMENIRIDTIVGRILNLLWRNVSKNVKHELIDLYIKNVTSREKLKFTTLPGQVGIVEPNQRLYIEECDGYCLFDGIYFENIYINGSKISGNNEIGWNLTEIGSTISILDPKIQR